MTLGDFEGPVKGVLMQDRRGKMQENHPRLFA